MSFYLELMKNYGVYIDVQQIIEGCHGRPGKKVGPEHKILYNASMYSDSQWAPGASHVKFFDDDQEMDGVY